MELMGDKMLTLIKMRKIPIKANLPEIQKSINKLSLTKYNKSENKNLNNPNKPIHFKMKMKMMDLNNKIMTNGITSIRVKWIKG